MAGMAEIGAIASVIGIVTAGQNLSTTLIEFASTVGSAAADIEAIATEISHVCLVLKRIESILRNARSNERYSVTALADIQQITSQCQLDFDKIREILEGLKKGKPKPDFRSRLIWTLKRPRVQILQKTSEKSKATLALLLTTLLVASSVPSPRYVLMVFSLTLC